jgi:hypothetical protein
LDSGPHFEWVPAKQKKSASSYAAVVSRGGRSPNSRVGNTQSMFSSLSFRSVPDLNLQPDKQPCSSPLSFNHGGSFLSRSTANSKSVGSDGPPFLSGANAVPLGNKHSKPTAGKPTVRPSCSRCLSNFHTRPNCRLSTRCTACFRLGHVAFPFRFPPWFPSLSKDGVFSTQVHSVAWDPLTTATWFKSMTSGASTSIPPVFTPVSSTSIPWFLPLSSFLSSAQSPPESLQDFFPESRVNLELRPPNPPPFQQSSPLPPPPLHSELPEPELQSQQENPAAATVSSSPPDKMAYQFVDPTPFIPRGFQRVSFPIARP